MTQTTNVGPNPEFIETGGRRSCWMHLTHINLQNRILLKTFRPSLNVQKRW